MLKYAASQLHVMKLGRDDLLLEMLKLMHKPMCTFTLVRSVVHIFEDSFFFEAECILIKNSQNCSSIHLNATVGMLRTTVVLYRTSV